MPFNIKVFNKHILIHVEEKCFSLRLTMAMCFQTFSARERFTHEYKYPVLEMVYSSSGKVGSHVYFYCLISQQPRVSRYFPSKEVYSATLWADIGDFCNCDDPVTGKWYWKTMFMKGKIYDDCIVVTKSLKNLSSLLSTTQPMTHIPEYVKIYGYIKLNLKVLTA